MRKFILLGILILIAVLSCSPNLKALDPTTWINPPHYGEIHFSFITNPEDRFYLPYTVVGKEAEFYLRKTGHVTVYALLCLVIFLNLNKFKMGYRLNFAWLLTTAVGIGDELNQYFIIGRDGRIMDVALNSTAGLFMLVLVVIFILKQPNTTKETSNYPL